MWIICWVLWIWLINHFDCGIQTSFCMLKRNPFWWELAMTLMSIFVLCLLRIWPWWVFCIFVCFYELLRKRGSCNCNPTSWIWMRFSGVQFEVMKNLHFTNHLYCTSYFSVIQKKKYKQTICGWLWILNKLIRVGHVYPISISLSYICLKCS